MPAFNIKMFKLLIKFTKDEVDTSGRFYFFCVFYFDEYLWDVHEIVEDLGSWIIKLTLNALFTLINNQ